MLCVVHLFSSSSWGLAVALCTVVQDKLGTPDGTSFFDWSVQQLHFYPWKGGPSGMMGLLSNGPELEHYARGYFDAIDNVF